MESRVHISLAVKDLERSVEFYSKLFGTGPTKLKSDYANFRLANPPLHLALVHAPERSRTEGSAALHYGIELFSDERLSACLQSAQENGFEPRIEEAVTCCYATANKFWLSDPDKNEWEFWVRLEDIHDEALNSSEAPEAKTKAKAKAKSCCAPGQC